MNLAFIAPTKYIDKFSTQGDFILALSHLLKHGGEYENAIINTNLPIILDNGLFENGKPEELESLVAKAVRINASHIFVPDYLGDSTKTREEVNKAYNYITKIGAKLKLCAVVQGKDKKDWFDLYSDFCKDDRISLIGLSILAIPAIYKQGITESRIQCMRDMLFLEELGLKHKKSHLLGLGDSYRDVLFAKMNCPWIVSNDTSSPVWNGFMGKKIKHELNVEGGKSKIPVDFNFTANDVQLKIAQKNITIIKQYLK